MSLHRDCMTWESVAQKLDEHENSIAVCLLAVNDEEHYDAAERLMRIKPQSDRLFPVFVRPANAEEDNEFDAAVA